MEAKRYQITVAGSGGSFGCREDEFLLPAMIQAGCGPVHHGCCGGGCGVCRMRVTQGDFFAAKRMSRAHVSEADEGEGIALLCCIQPRSDMVIAEV